MLENNGKDRVLIPGIWCQFYPERINCGTRKQKNTSSRESKIRSANKIIGFSDIGIIGFRIIERILYLLFFMLYIIYCTGLNYFVESRFRFVPLPMLSNVSYLEISFSYQGRNVNKCSLKLQIPCRNNQNISSPLEFNCFYFNIIINYK